MDTKISNESDWRLKVFDSLSFPTLILKPDRTIVAANQVFLEKIGASLDRICGRTCRDLFRQYFYDPALPCSDDQCPLVNTLKHRRGHSVLRKISGPDGEDRWEDRVFSPILGDDGDVIYVIESIRDVTRVKVLEQEVSGIRELMNKAVQSSVSAIIAADLKGKIILMNQAAEDLFGYRMDEANSVDIRNFYPAGIAREIMKKLRGDALGGKGKLPITKVTILTKNDEQIPVEMTAAIIYENGHETASMGIFNDLREQLSVEKKLQEAQAQVVQSEKMASLGMLAAGVAHEINNPLTSILLYGNLMLEKLEADHPLRQHIEFVLEDAERCRDIVKNLLAYSRQTKPSNNVFQLNQLVEESLRLLRDQSLFMNIKIKKELADYPMLINADKNQLNQVVINLIINAVDAMNREGTITFRTYRDRRAGKVFLEVSDTGCGILSKDIANIFDPFFTTKEHGKGTGLGLSTAYGIVKKNNGQISVKQTSPKGTTMLLKLPAVSTPETHAYELIE